MTINSIQIIYIGIILCILLYIYKCIHANAWGYKLVYIYIYIYIIIGKVKKKSN